MLWLSADFSKESSGLALWRDSTLMTVSTVRIKGKLGKHTLGEFTYATDIEAWAVALRSPRGETVSMLVHEAGLGHNMKAARILAEHRGGVLMLWRTLGGGPTVSVNVNEWTRVARETLSCGDLGPGQWSWPSDTDARKRLSAQVVNEHFGPGLGRFVNGDEADAVLVGHWAVRTGRVSS